MPNANNFSNDMDASLVAAMFKINVAIVNFRPAIHGFYSNAYLEPNLGLKDIRTAIQWLHQQNLKNIDYDQVTIGGVGSGASLAAMQVFHDSVENHKLVRPGTEPPKNLLHRGIFLGGTFNSRFALSPSYQKIKLNLILHKFFKQHNLYEYAENEYLNETALTEIFQKQIKNYELTNLQDRISQDELDIFHNLAEIDDKFLKNLVKHENFDNLNLAIYNIGNQSKQGIQFGRKIQKQMFEKNVFFETSAWSKVNLEKYDLIFGLYNNATANLEANKIYEFCDRWNCQHESFISEILAKKWSLDQVLKQTLSSLFWDKLYEIYEEECEYFQIYDQVIDEKKDLVGKIQEGEHGEVLELDPKIQKGRDYFDESGYFDYTDCRFCDFHKTTLAIKILEERTELAEQEEQDRLNMIAEQQEKDRQARMAGTKTEKSVVQNFHSSEKTASNSKNLPKPHVRVKKALPFDAKVIGDLGLETEAKLMERILGKIKNFYQENFPKSEKEQIVNYLTDYQYNFRILMDYFDSTKKQTYTG